MELQVDELLHPIHIPKMALARHESIFRDVTQRGVANVEHWFSTRDEMLAASKLNQRGQREYPPGLSSRSALNVRYAEATRKPESQYALASPSVSRQPSAVTHPRNVNRSVSSASAALDVSVATSDYPGNNIPPIFSRSIEDVDMSHSVMTSPSTVADVHVNGGDIKLSRGSAMNERYVTPEVTSISTASKLNQRYLKKPQKSNGMANGHAVKSTSGASTPVAQGRYVKNPKAVRQRQSQQQVRDRSTPTPSQQSDLSPWVDDIFNPILDDNSDEFAPPLPERIKGEGGLVAKKENLESWTSSLLGSYDVKRSEEEVPLSKRIKGVGDESRLQQYAVRHDIER